MQEREYRIVIMRTHKASIDIPVVASEKGKRRTPLLPMLLLLLLLLLLVSDNNNKVLVLLDAQEDML